MPAVPPEETAPLPPPAASPTAVAVSMAAWAKSRFPPARLGTMAFWVMLLVFDAMALVEYGAK